MNLTFYRFLISVYLSFYCKKFYRFVYQKWEGFGFKYLFFLSTLVVTPLLLQIYDLTRDIYDNNMFDQPGSVNSINKTKNRAGRYIADIINQLPEIKVKDGVATTDAPEPFYIYDSITNEILVIIDTKDGITNINDANTTALVNSKMVSVKYSGRIFQYSFRNLDNNEVTTINPETAKNYLKKSRNAIKFQMPIFIFCFSILVSFINLSLKSAIFGFIGVMVTNFKKNEDNFESMFRIAVVSAGPFAVFEFFSPVFYKVIPEMIFIFLQFFIMVGYFVFAIKSIKPLETIENNKE